MDQEARERQREEAARINRPLPDAVRVKVVGVTFVDSYPDNLHRLKEIAETRGLDLDHDPQDDQPPPSPGHQPDARLEASLIREPDNPADANAIAVLAVGEKIGHVPRAIAARLAPELDAGRSWTCDVTGIVYWPDKPEQPGAWIELRRTFRRRTED